MLQNVVVAIASAIEQGNNTMSYYISPSWIDVIRGPKYGYQEVRSQIRRSEYGCQDIGMRSNLTTVSTALTLVIHIA